MYVRYVVLFLVEHYLKYKACLQDSVKLYVGDVVLPDKDRWIQGIATDKKHKKCNQRIYIEKGSSIKGEQYACGCKEWKK